MGLCKSEATYIVQGRKFLAIKQQAKWLCRSQKYSEKEMIYQTKKENELSKPQQVKNINSPKDSTSQCIIARAMKYQEVR